MLYDLSPHVSLEGFFALWLVAITGLGVWLTWPDRGEDE